MRRQSRIVAPKPRRFASGTTVKFERQIPVGLGVCADVLEALRDMLMKLIDSYAQHHAARYCGRGDNADKGRWYRQDQY